MQVTPTSVSVRGDDNETKVIENPTVLMGDFGMWVKTTNTLEMYPWEKVVRLSFGDQESIKKVWEEAVLTVFEDLLEDFEDDFGEEEEELQETEKTTPTSAKPKEPEAPSSADDPEKNPYE
jgi:hypothetical protein